MQTLDAPVYEVKQDSEWYKKTMARRKRQEKFFKEINEKYFKDNGFSYYHSEWFGVQGDSEDYEVYKNELRKNPDKNGVHIFKKNSKYFKAFKEMLDEVEGDFSPFASHDRLGLNNMSGSQWIGDRWFFGVKRESEVKSDEVEKIDFKDYLAVVAKSLDE
ncbi:hypothetical protein [Halobacillus karajensis]|uniref:Uncharacterized protein n=1 Tax=Halobacillus karajensis TaxID=195088 RepID=A0A059NWB0_9BACI|nr:hypothetical protein [Halobacillus karajensis]CDQ22608.1 hypothetical protein BN983_00821 [Halobacillus karajensis]CDQ26090.1 hypothetical protein BN981_00301 [Halobacillus karajensis]